MSKKLWVSLLLVVAFSLHFVLGAHAQDPEPRDTPTPAPTEDEDGEDTDQDGEGDTEQDQDANLHGGIRGTVFRDANNDGQCGTEAEGPLPGVPVRFLSEGGNYELYLQSGSDGTFGLAAAGLATWEVAAQPSAGQGVVTSASPQYVTIDESNRLALGINFCIGTARAGQVVLPQSGAPAAPGFWLAVLVGFLLLGSGAGLYLRRFLLRR